MLLSLLPVLSLAALAVAHPHHGGLRRHASHQARALRERPIQMNEGLHLAKPEDKALERRAFDGMRATYYDAGLGACGITNSGSDFIVALNTPQFGSGYPGPNCFKSITIQYNGITAQATVTDQCPGCPYGGLDLTQSLMEHFVGVGNALNVGVISINWWFNDEAPAPAPAPATSTYVAPAPETTWQAPTSEYVPPASSAWVDPSPWTSQQQQQATQAAPSPESSWAPAPAPSSSAWVDPSPWTSQQQASSSAAAPPSQAPASSASSDQASISVSVSGSSQYSSMGSFNASVAASASAGSVSNAGSSSASSSSSSSSSAGPASNASSSASGNASTVATVPGSGSNLADLNALIVQLGGSAATIIAQSS